MPAACTLCGTLRADSLARYCRENLCPQCVAENPALTLVPGARFATPFESGCVVITAPDSAGIFYALDSDGVECSYNVSMVIA